MPERSALSLSDCAIAASEGHRSGAAGVSRSSPGAAERPDASAQGRGIPPVSVRHVAELQTSSARSSPNGAGAGVVTTAEVLQGSRAGHARGGPTAPGAGDGSALGAGRKPGPSPPSRQSTRAAAFRAPARSHGPRQQRRRARLAADAMPATRSSRSMRRGSARVSSSATSPARSPPARGDSAMLETCLARQRRRGDAGGWRPSRRRVTAPRDAPQPGAASPAAYTRRAAARFPASLAGARSAQQRSARPRRGPAWPGRGRRSPGAARPARRPSTTRADVPRRDNPAAAARELRQPTGALYAVCPESGDRRAGRAARSCATASFVDGAAVTWVLDRHPIDPACKRWPEDAACTPAGTTSAGGP